LTPIRSSLSAAERLVLPSCSPCSPAFADIAHTHPILNYLQSVLSIMQGPCHKPQSGTQILSSQRQTLIPGRAGVALTIPVATAPIGSRSTCEQCNYIRISRTPLRFPRSRGGANRWTKYRRKLTAAGAVLRMLRRPEMLQRGVAILARNRLGPSRTSAICPKARFSSPIRPMLVAAFTHRKADHG
jgi:hypothetical protein